MYVGLHVALQDSPYFVAAGMDATRLKDNTLGVWIKRCRLKNLDDAPESLPNSFSTSWCNMTKIPRTTVSGCSTGSHNKREPTTKTAMSASSFLGFYRSIAIRGILLSRR